MDGTKGICIVLVVLFHSTLVDATPPETGVWWAVNAVFATLRMPLFFLASGLFAASVLRGSWTEVLRGRVLLLVYVYVLWLTLRRLYFGLLAGELDLTWQDYALPDSDMWFLYVLAVFFVAGRATWPVRSGVLIPAAAAVSVAASSVSLQRDFYRFDDMALYFVFFVFGCRFSAAILERAARVTVVQAAGACGGFLGMSVTIAAVGLGDVPPFRFLTTVAALLAGLTVAVALDRSRLGRLLAFIGQRSLPVYVLHMIFVRTLVEVAETHQWDVQSHALGPIWLTAFAVLASVLAHSALRAVPGLFRTPRWLQRAIGGHDGGPRVALASLPDQRTDEHDRLGNGPRARAGRHSEAADGDVVSPVKVLRGGAPLRG